MPSTYTSNNKIQKIATGEQSGTWGNTTNTNFDLFDTAIDGFVSITLSGTTHTLNIPDGSAGDGRNKVLVFTGTLAATNTVSVTPNTVKKHYYVQNNTTGGQNIVISQGSGSSVTIKPGYSSIVYLDGAGSGAAVKEVLTSLKLTALLEATGAVLNGSSSGSTTLQASATASGTLTLPAATDTLVGKATTDTFTNKTFDTAGTGNVLRINGTQVSAVTGTGSVVLATSPTLVTPLLGTPTSGTLTNCTGLPVSTGISGLGANVATFLATPSSANLASAVTDETGSGALVFATSPVLVTPILGTPNSGNLANCFGYNVNVLAGAGTGVREALAVNVGTAGSFVVNGGVLGTPSSGTLTNCTGLPVSTGISGLGSGVATFLATPSSANLAAAVTDETGTGALVFGTSPTIATPTITTSATVPLVIGGTGTTSTLTLRSTSGVGTTGADIIFQAGNNGATEVMRLQNGGNVGIGTSSPGEKLVVVGNIVAGNTGTTADGYIDIDGGATGKVRISRTGTGATASGMVFYTQFSTLQERMRILSTGEVGIGTSSPSRTLDVNGSCIFGNVVGVVAGDSAPAQIGVLTFGQSTTSTYAWIQSWSSRPLAINPSGNNVGIGTSSPVGKLDVVTGVYRGYFDDAAGSLFRLNAVNAANSAYGPLSVNGSVVTFQISASEKMRIDSSGNVGIGTSSVATKLVVLDANRVVDTSGNVNIYTSDNQAAGLGGVLGLGGKNGSGATDPYVFATLRGAKENSTSSNYAGYMSMHTTTSAGVVTERMRIDSSGNVGIGTSSPSTLLHVKSSSTNNARLRIDTSSASAGPYLEFAENGTVKWYQTNDYTTDRLYIVDENSNDGVYLAQNATSWTANSDARLKNVIGPILGAVEKLNSINGVLYSWKSDPKNRVYPGVLAQDVQSVLPEAVDSDVPERLGVRYTELIPLLVNAIKELKAEIDILKARN